MNINELTDRILNNLKTSEVFSSADSFTQGYIKMLVKNIILYVDSEISIKEIIKDGVYSADPELIQKIPGIPAVHSLAAGNPGILTSFAGEYSRMEFTDYDSACREAIIDFLELNNGLFAVDYKLSSPDNSDYQLSGSYKSSGENYLIPVSFRFGTVTFALLF